MSLRAIMTLIPAAVLSIAACAFGQRVPFELLPELTVPIAPTTRAAGGGGRAVATPPVTTRPATLLREWLIDLADTDPSVRERARFNLMGLHREELDLLRELVVDSRPLAPSQSAVLHDIVLHVYLAGDAYPRNVRSGFLGVMLENVRQPAFFRAEQDAAAAAPPDEGAADKEASAPAPAEAKPLEPQEPPVQGVLIKDCVPGFCAFRFLRPGDLVMAVTLPSGEVVPTLVDNDLKEQVLSTRPGAAIALQVLRQGKEMQVSFAVDALPRAAEMGIFSTEQFRNTRRDAAEDYWRQAFAPLVDAGMS